MSESVQHTSAHGEHTGNARFLAHHFASHDEQFDAGKLGMWLFLVQEILFFSGLFCAYAIYRSNHPEIFQYADHFLDRKLGAINTCVLIFSSFTVAWAVRAAQLNQRKLCAGLLAITLACAGGFLCIKYVEYHHKFHDGLLWGKHFNPSAEASAPEATSTGQEVAKMPTDAELAANPDGHPATPPHDTHDVLSRPKNTHIFFGIYFAMTGLHAIHVIIGMGVIIWMIIRTLRGDFNSEYFAPVEFTGLYWHLVDLVWIYLFPLLYLIH